MTEWGKPMQLSESVLRLKSPGGNKYTCDASHARLWNQASSLRECGLWL